MPSPENEIDDKLICHPRAFIQQLVEVEADTPN